MKILYEDNHLLVVEKPINVPVQGDASGDLDLLRMAKGYVKEKYQKAGEVFLGLVHRLDRPVGGVMVFARTSKAAARLTAQFKARQVKKRYVAIVDGDPPAAAVLTDCLLKDERTNTTVVVPEGGKQAELRFQTLARNGGQSLLDIQPDTGRPHQIRVQLAHAGLPIHGDMRYHPQAKPGTQIRLWAYALTLSHPTQGEKMTFFSRPDWQKPPSPRGGADQIGRGEWSAQLALLPAFSVCAGVYLNEELVVVDKHSGVEVEPDLVVQLAPLLGEVFPVHRLDANTEGLVVLARTERARAQLEQEFYEHRTRKLYHVVVCGTPREREGKLVHWGIKDAALGFMSLCEKDTPGAQRMALTWRVLETNKELSKLEILLETGRTHQIRVQLAAIGRPVLGDEKYGDFAANKRYKVRRQQLLAKELEVLGLRFTSEKNLSLPCNL